MINLQRDSSFSSTRDVVPLTSHQSSVAVTGPYIPCLWSHGATVVRLSMSRKQGEDVAKMWGEPGKELPVRVTNTFAYCLSGSGRVGSKP